jgi:hypothetical protein
MLGEVLQNAMGYEISPDSMKNLPSKILERPTERNSLQISPNLKANIKHGTQSRLR